MKLPKPKSIRTSEEKHFVPLTIDGYSYTIMISCLPGYQQTMDDPGEPPSVEINKLFDVNGEDITDKVSEKDWEELDEWFNNPPEKSSISFGKINMEEFVSDNPLLETPIQEFELTVRALNCLKMADIKTFGELINHSREKIVKLVGKKTMKELDTFLLSKGRNWKPITTNKK